MSPKTYRVGGKEFVADHPGQAFQLFQRVEVWCEALTGNEGTVVGVNLSDGIGVTYTVHLDREVEGLVERIGVFHHLLESQLRSI